MCEIQAVISATPLTTKEKDTFIRMLEEGSFGNDDAWGAYYNGKVYKESGCPEESDGLFERFKTILHKGTSNFIFGHNRMTTNGLAKYNYNNHPFETENFVVVHNGIINNHASLKALYGLQYKEDVDSYIIPALMENNIDYFENEGELIKSVAEEISGTYSVLIYSKRNDCLYYFKNCSTSVSIMSCNNTLFLSTDKNSIKFWSENVIFRPRHRMGHIEPLVIYKIDMNARISIVDEFVEKTYTYTSFVKPKSSAKDSFTKEVEYLMETVEDNFKIMSWYIDEKTSSLVLYVEKQTDIKPFELLIREQSVWDIVTHSQHRKTTQFVLQIDDNFRYVVEEEEGELEARHYSEGAYGRYVCGSDKYLEHNPYNYDKYEYDDDNRKVVKTMFER